MNRTAFAIHLSICLIAGAIASWLGGVNWLAAAFWCSAVLYFNGAMADAEDSEPGGFDNPGGEGKRLGFAHALKSVGVVVLLGAAGFAIQSWLGNSAS